MNTTIVKSHIIEAFYNIIEDLTLREVEDLKDALTVREFHLTDTGERHSMEELMSEFDIDLGDNLVEKVKK